MFHTCFNRMDINYDYFKKEYQSNKPKFITMLNNAVRSPFQEWLLLLKIIPDRKVSISWKLFSESIFILIDPFV